MYKNDVPSVILVLSLDARSGLKIHASAHWTLYGDRKPVCIIVSVSQTDTYTLTDVWRVHSVISESVSQTDTHTQWQACGECTHTSSDSVVDTASQADTHTQRQVHGLCVVLLWECWHVSLHTLYAHVRHRLGVTLHLLSHYTRVWHWHSSDTGTHTRTHTLTHTHTHTHA